MKEGEDTAADQAFVSAVNTSRFGGEGIIETPEVQNMAKVLFLGVM